MKIYGIIATMVAMLFATMASAQSPNNAVWGVNDHNEVLRWNSSTNEFEVMPGILKQVSIGTDGEVWGVNPADDVFRWTGSQWQQVQGMKLKQLSVRNGQEVWGVDADNHLFRWTGSAWEPIGFTTAFVSAGADGTVWGIGGPGTGGVIQTISTWLADHQLIALESTGSNLKRIWVTDWHRQWAIDDNAQLFRRTEEMGEPPQWQHFDGKNYIDVAEAANGELWRLDSNGTLFGPQLVYGKLQLKQIAVGSAGLTDEERQMLDAHNRERQNYPGIGALQWSPELGRYAQEWAQAVASGDKSGHRPDQRNNPFRPGEGLGENMYCGFPSSGVTGVNAVSWFISEKKWYHYDQDNGGGPLGEPPGCTAPPGGACGHFTQVIWKNTQYVGCGKAISPGNLCDPKSPTDSIWYVCNYYPPGNWNRQKPY
jgi:hypothetical protein